MATGKRITIIKAVYPIIAVVLGWITFVPTASSHLWFIEGDLEYAGNLHPPNSYEFGDAFIADKCSYQTKGWKLSILAASLPCGITETNKHIAVTTASTSADAATQQRLGSRRICESVAELLGGGIGGAIGLLGGIFVVWPFLMIIDEENVVALFPAGVLLASVVAYGSADGVSMVGEMLGDEGVFRWAFVGGLIPPLAGAVLGLSGERRLELFPCPVCGAMRGSLASPLGATIGYALSQRPQLSQKQALLNIEKSNLQFGIPSVALKPVLSKNKVILEYRMKLLNVSF